MKIRYEAVILGNAEGVINLANEEVAEYQALTSDEQRTEWLRKQVAEVAYDEIYLQEIDTWDAHVDEDPNQ